MNFDFTPIEVVYDLDEEIRKKVYALYDKYQKSKTQSSLYDLLEYIYQNKDTIYRKEFFDLKINEHQTVFDVYLEEGNDLDQEDAKFFSQYEEFAIKGLLKGKFGIAETIPEDTLFKKINGITLLEHLINNSDFRPFVLTNIKTRTEVIDILKRNNQTRLMQFLDEDILFTPYDENQTVIEYLIENDLFSPRFLDTINHHPEIYDILIKYNKTKYAMLLSSEMLMQERNGRIILDELLDNGYQPSIINVVNEDMVKILLKYGLEYELSNIPLKFAFMDVEGKEEKLFEYLTREGIYCYEVVGEAVERNEHMKEIIDILEDTGRLFMLQNLSEEQLLQTYGRDKTLLETLLENNVAITNAEVTKKETFDLLVAYSRYDELSRSNEEMLLQTLPNGNKLYQELIKQRKNIEAEGINNYEIVDAILNQSDIRLIHCIGTESLLSNFTLNETCLDIILKYAKEQDKKILGYLRFEDATLNEYAKIIIAHAKAGFLGKLRDLDKNQLLDDSQGTTLLEELLREDELLTTYTILNDDLRRDVEIATILKIHGIDQQKINYDEEYKFQYAQRYIEKTIDGYKLMPITPEQEKIHQELYNVLNDGKTQLEIIDMVVASYRQLYSIGNPYAEEVKILIEMKKNNPDFHIELTDDGACYTESEKTIYLDNLNPQVFHHELGHAFFDIIYKKYIPEDFKELLKKLNRSTVTRIKLENYDSLYSKTSSKVSDRIWEKISKSKETYDMDKIKLYLSSFTDGLEQKLIDRGYNPAVVKRILSETYSAEEFIRQEERISHGELLDTMLRIEHSSVQGLGDFFDGIYKGAYHDGTMTGILSGASISGYGHGRNYYSQGIEYVFDEMIANYAAIIKMAGPEIGMTRLEKYLGSQLAQMISNTYNQMVLQNDMTQSINQTQSTNLSL